MEHQTPEMVYRLATREEWFITEETGVAPSRDIDKQDGYMHLSTRAQVLETANIHFSDATDLLVMEIPMTEIGAQVKFEMAPKRGEAFPHFYGALRREHVTRTVALQKTADGFQFGDEC